MVNNKKSPARIALEQAKKRRDDITSAMLLLEALIDGTVNGDNNTLEYVAAAHSFLVPGSTGPRTLCVADVIQARIHAEFAIKGAINEQ